MLKTNYTMSTFEALERYRKKMPFNTITIDGNIINGYFIYTYFDDKTYAESPKRSTIGGIDNLNSYVTFLTPRLRINFSFMKLKTYQILMKLIQQKNEFVVTCYDPVWDRTINKKMYFYPQDFPEIFQKNLEILGMINYEIELVGTNTEVELLNITYHSNDNSDRPTQTSYDFSYGQQVLVGRGITFPDEPKTGKRFTVWNDKADGTGFTYLHNQVYTPIKSLTLYAQWDGSL